MDLTTFYSQFRDEAAENIRAFSRGLVALEGGDLEPDARRQLIDQVFRAIHTIKGGARLLGFEDVSRVAHTCEHILGAVREGRREIDRPLIDDLLRGGDAILELIQAAVEGRPATVDVEALELKLGRSSRRSAPQSTPPAQVEPITLAPLSFEHPTPPIDHPPRPARATGRQTIRVRVDRLDRLLNLAGELLVGQQAQVAHLQTLEAIATLIAHQERAILALEAEIGHLRASPLQRELLDRHLNAALNTGEQASQQIRAQIERFEHYAGHTSQLVENLEQEVMAVRLLPISTLYTNLPRAVRELAHELGKEVALTLRGETTELDRKVIEALNDPLVHLIRNAIDHGVEPAELREQAGKPRQGQIEVSAEAFGSYVRVVVRDDGRGMHPPQLREIAVRKGLIAPDAAAALVDHEAIELIFMPGFSTAPLITDISGRGVGMDVVRTSIVEVGGQVQVESHPGIGTTVILTLPLTLVTTRVLLVELGEQLFALPASACQGSVWARPEELRTIEGQAMLPSEGRHVPLLRLADLLGVPATTPFPLRRRSPAILIGSPQRPLALLVDRLADEREVVVKPLGPLVERLKQYSGAIQLEDGRLVLLLYPSALMQMARGMALESSASLPHPPRSRPNLLVVDDSFATRELIRSILQSAGYETTTAVDGLDALDKLRAAAYDLVVTDIEMPRVDGFELTSRIRSDPAQRDLPVILVTSLASESHRRRGLEAGAQAYIVKSQFDQSNLLETIRQLLGDA